MNKYLIVDLKGGLGNQLFTISFAQYLKQKGFRVIIDTSFYKQSHDFPRKLNIDINDFGFQSSVNINSDLVFKLINSRFEEINDIKEIHLKFVNRFKGYYQNTKFLDKNYLKKSLSINDEKKKNSLLIHIRRGDYVRLKEDLRMQYFYDAFNYINKFKKNLKIDVFTDDENFNENNLSNIRINKLYNSQNENPLKLFKEMARYENYIISNSTYSFLAALLGENKNSIICYPNPWMRNSSLEIIDLPEKWIPVKNI